MWLSVGLAWSASPGTSRPWLQTPMDCACKEDASGPRNVGVPESVCRAELALQPLAQGAESGVGPEAGGPFRDQAKLRFRQEAAPAHPPKRSRQVRTPPNLQDSTRRSGA